MMRLPMSEDQIIAVGHRHHHHHQHLISDLCFVDHYAFLFFRSFFFFIKVLLLVTQEQNRMRSVAEAGKLCSLIPPGTYTILNIYIYIVIISYYYGVAVNALTGATQCIYKTIHFHRISLFPDLHFFPLNSF